LPSWEFWALVEAHQELEAQFLLDTLNMQSIASGNLKENDSKDLIKVYRQKAGLDKWKEMQRIETKRTKSWVSGLRAFMGGKNYG